MAKEKNGNWFARHKIVTVILGIVVLVIVVQAVNGGSKSTSNTAANASTSSEKKDDKKADTVAKLGQKVRDGKFEFTVTRIKCGETTVGSEYLHTKAQGQFCRLHLKVENIGDEAQTLDSTSQYAYNAKGQKYTSDDTANIYADSDGSGSTWFQDINPGNSVSGDIFFDVPKGVTPVTAELHDSAFSSGVKVDLQ